MHHHAIAVIVGSLRKNSFNRKLASALAYLDVPTLGQPEAFVQKTDGLFDPDGRIGESIKKFLQSWMDQYVAWIKVHNAETIGV